MRLKTRSAVYPPLPFHAIRVSGWISSLIVAAIMFFFMYHLRHDGFKLPWTFLVLIASSCLTILNFAFTSFVHCCHGMPPLLSLVFNSLLLILWSIALGLLCWSMSGTLMTTCSTSNWGTDTGIMVCRLYKVLFTFTVTAFVAQFAAVILDVIVRRRQANLGEYDPMLSDAALADVKIQRGSVASSTNTNDPSTDAYNAFGTSRPQPRRQQPTYGASLEQYHAGEAQDYYEHAPTRGGAMKLDNFRGYAQPPEQTRYDPAEFR